MREEPLFVKGDKVVCIESKKHPLDESPLSLIEGKIYCIEDVNRCKCGRITVDIGHAQRPEYTTFCDCHSVISKTKILYDQKRFVPLDTDRAIESAIFEALKGQTIVN